MKIRYLESARDDMMWFRTYYGRFFPEGSGNARTQLRQVVALICEHPDVGHVPEGVQGALEFPIRRTPFTVVYRVKDDELQIMRLYDQRSAFANER